MKDLYAEAGSLSERYAAVDWAATPLGAVEGWSDTLTATLRMAFRTRFPVTLLWGPRFVMLYNDAYIPLIADKHPDALGVPAADVFPEIWSEISPLLKAAEAGGDGIWAQDLRLLMDRHGFLEETYFTFSYSAVADSAGRVEGVIDIATETTAQVIGNRRLQLLHRLNEQLADVRDHRELIERALPVLNDAPDDLTEVRLTIPDLADDVTPPMPPVAVPRTDARPVLSLLPGRPGRTVHLLFPGRAPGADSVLTAGLSPHLPVDDVYLGFLRLVGGSVGQALDRIQARLADRALRSMERAMSETLQRTLLTRAAHPESLDVAVRYQSSIAQARIGGDWYDSFLLPDGTLMLAIGDVSGHDREAAAAMAQIRNLLRGIAFTIEHPPSRILTRLDLAMKGLAVGAFATTVLAEIRQSAEQAERGLRTMCWSNAGHPPPMLITADGAVRVLPTPPETLLGTRADVRRRDHEVVLEPGATVVLYTDGLIERRHGTYDHGLEHLRSALAGGHEIGAEQLCDRLLQHFGAGAEDDIALAVLRTHRDGDR